jgi:hypothetical protein
MTALLKTKEWDSKSTLLAYLEGSGSRTILIGIEAEGPRKFYSFSFTSEEGSFEIGILSSDLGTKPGIILLKKGQKIFVGHDMWLTCIDTRSVSLDFKRRLNGVFYEFISLDTDDQVVVLHELGIVRFDADGGEVWAVDTDVIEHFYADSQGNATLSMMDQVVKIVVSLDSGKVTFDPAQH